MGKGSERTLTLPQVAALAEIEYRTLHTWLARGLLRATRRRSHGAGVPNLFAVEDALEARVLADLRRAGLELDAVERTARALQDAPLRLTGEEMLLINGRVSICTDERELHAALNGLEPALIYNVAAARRALVEA